VRIYNRALTSVEVRKIATAGTTTLGKNVIDNPSFEESDAPDAFARAWTAHAWEGPLARFSVGVDSSYARTGRRSLQVVNADVGGRRGAYAVVALEAGVYEVTYRACADVGKTAEVQAHLGGVDLDAVSVGEAWQEITQTVEFERPRPGSGLKLWVVSAGGRAWFDDVEVKRVR
jgi:hypothetical protein